MKRPVVVAALGTAQTLAWRSSYFLPAILADPRDLLLSLSPGLCLASARPCASMTRLSPR
jgi:hypothetical protein